MQEEKIKELKIQLMRTVGGKGRPAHRRKIRREIARLKTKENAK